MRPCAGRGGKISLIFTVGGSRGARGRGGAGAAGGEGRAAGGAMGARAARAARDARDARAARDARDAIAASAARDARDASDAIAASAASDAIDARGAKQSTAPAKVPWAANVFEAFVAGAWIVYWTDDTLYWFAKPTVHLDATPGTRRLHCANGPALESDAEDLS